MGSIQRGVLRSALVVGKVLSGTSERFRCANWSKGIIGFSGSPTCARHMVLTAEGCEVDERKALCDRTQACRSC